MIFLWKYDAFTYESRVPKLTKRIEPSIGDAFASTIYIYIYIIKHFAAKSQRSESVDVNT